MELHRRSLGGVAGLPMGEITWKRERGGRHLPVAHSQTYP